MSRETVAVVGAGVIGCSFAAWYAAKGYHVRIFDVRDNYESTVRKMLQTQLSEVPGTNVDEAQGRISCFTTLEEACEGADLVQENGPEKIDFKQSMFADLEKICGSETFLVTSSSGITPDIIGEKMKAPERVMIGHPFNPPHVVPVVEVCTGPNTPEALVSSLMDFYERADRVPIRLNKPIYGFVGSRLHVAMVREAIHIVEEGVVDIKSLDKLVMASYGIRWASVGPMLGAHLGGGAGGLRGLIEAIGKDMMTEMGLKQVSTKAMEMLDEQAGRYYPMDHCNDFTAVRDARELAMLDIQKKNPLPSPESK